MTEPKNPDARGQQKKVRLYGQPDSAEAYEIRDFLNRTVVEFDWIALTCDADCAQELRLPSLSNVRLPVLNYLMEPNYLPLQFERLLNIWDG